MWNAISLGVVGNEKGAFGLPSTTAANFLLFFYMHDFSIKITHEDWKAIQQKKQKPILRCILGTENILLIENAFSVKFLSNYIYIYNTYDIVCSINK